MTPTTTSAPTLTTAAVFPENYFLENLAVRSDDSILVTVLNKRELWYLPPPTAEEPVEPVLVHTFEHLALGIVEAEADVFYVSTSDVYTTHESSLQRLDLRGWTPGQPVHPQPVATFDDRVGGLNGSCLIAESTILLADCFAGLIWRVDLPTDGGVSRARVWLAHDSMAFDPDNPLTPPQPGINGVRYAARSRFLYYTSTAHRLFMRVAVDPSTHDPVGEPELVAGGAMADDFCIAEDEGVAFLATHRENTIDRVTLEPAGNQERVTVVGDPFTDTLIGPSSLAWSRRPGTRGRVMYCTTDGGTTSPPPDGIVRPATVMRLALPAHDAVSRSPAATSPPRRSDPVPPTAAPTSTAPGSSAPHRSPMTPTAKTPSGTS